MKIPYDCSFFYAFGSFSLLGRDFVQGPSWPFPFRSFFDFCHFTSDLKMEHKALEEFEKFGISRVKNLEHWDKLGFEVR